MAISLNENNNVFEYTWTGPNVIISIFILQYMLGFVPPISDRMVWQPDSYECADICFSINSKFSGIFRSEANDNEFRIIRARHLTRFVHIFNRIVSLFLVVRCLCYFVFKQIIERAGEWRRTRFATLYLRTKRWTDGTYTRNTCVLINIIEKLFKSIRSVAMHRPAG